MSKIIGSFLVIVCLAILGFTYFPLLKEETKYQFNRIQSPTPREIIPVDRDFGIVIPKLGINAKVIKNVDPFDSNIYQKALTLGVAHAKGTALPGEEGNIFIFSHSSENFYLATRYNSIFYLLNKLNNGDEIDLYYDDQKYIYHAFQKQIVSPNAIDILKPSRSNTLTLMTCFPPGTDIKRLVVIAQ